MNKSKPFENSHFKADILKESLRKAQSLRKDGENGTEFRWLSVSHDDGSRWQYDNLNEFLPEYRKYRIFSWFYVAIFDITINVEFKSNNTYVVISSDSRQEIEEIFDIFESNAESAKLPKLSFDESKKPTVFIGHGRSAMWRDLKDHLHDKHGFPVEAYETGARTGHVIRDILDEMVEKSRFAILVLTAEDEQSDGQLRARQNVIHEAGLFQGRLGFPRAILVIEEDVEELSNFDGIQHIKFAKGNIKEIYGDVLATLRREFPDSL